MKSITSVQGVVGLWVFLVAVISVCNFLYSPAKNEIVLAGDPNEPVTIVCEPLSTIVSDKTVVLRVDDIQAYAWPSTTRMMIEDAESRNAPLTLGIIPKKFTNDTELVAYLKAKSCRHEFALHGFDHKSHGENEELAEFENLTKEEALHLLQDGLEEISIVSDTQVETWIPPLNRHSTGTVEALLELGITRHSTEGEAKWDYDASTFSYDTNALTPTDKVLADCEASFAESDVCIIMLHPQDFTTNNFHDADKYDAYYLDLLDRLFGRGYGFGTFSSVS